MTAIDKQSLTVIAIFLTVISIVAGVLGSQYNHVQAEVDKRTEIVYSIPQLEKKIDSIDQKITRIEDKLDSLSKG